MQPDPTTDQRPLVATPESSATEPQIAAPTEAPAVETPGGAQAVSLVDRLREKRNNIGSKAKPLDLKIPGYEGLLVGRFKWVDYKTLTDGAKDLKNVTEPTEAQVRAAADVIVTCLTELLAHDGEGLKPLSEVIGGEPGPVTFGDPRLPEAFDFPPQSTAIDTAKALFNNEYALINLSNIVTEWLQDTTLKIHKDLLGNS